MRPESEFWTLNIFTPQIWSYSHCYALQYVLVFVIPWSCVITFLDSGVNPHVGAGAASCQSESSEGGMSSDGVGQSGTHQIQPGRDHFLTLFSGAKSQRYSGLNKQNQTCVVTIRVSWSIRWVMFEPACVPARVSEEAEAACAETVAPYLSSILEALTEHISAGIQEMRSMLHTHMDSAFTHTNGQTEETNKVRHEMGEWMNIFLQRCSGVWCVWSAGRVLVELHQSGSVLQSGDQADGETGGAEEEVWTEQHSETSPLCTLGDGAGKSRHQRSGAAQQKSRLPVCDRQTFCCVVLQLLDGAVYTLELFLQSSARLQSSQVPVKLERAKERVLKVRRSPGSGGSTSHGI